MGMSAPVSSHERYVSGETPSSFASSSGVTSHASRSPLMRRPIWAKSVMLCPLSPVTRSSPRSLHRAGAAFHADLERLAVGLEQVLTLGWHRLHDRLVE